MSAVDNLFDLRVARGAPAARLGVVGDLFDRLEVVFPNNPFDFLVGDTVALADDNAFFVFVGHIQAPPAGKGRLQSLLAHDRAVHFLGRQTS